MEAGTSALGDGGKPLLEDADLVAALKGHRLMRRMSSMELSGINAALDVIGEERNRLLEAEGLSQVSFFLGILNVPLLCFVLAWWPQHFWVVYCLECVLLIPAWLLQMHRIYNGALFLLDFCWVVNSLFSLCMLYMLWRPWATQETCLQAFLVFFSVSLGPLAWACILLHNGLVFHSIEKTASLTIHLLPLFVAWTVVNSNDRLQEAWPGRFPTATQLGEVTLEMVFLHGFGVYFVWWLLHSLWLLSVGIHQPSKGRSTVFEGLYRKSNMGAGLKKYTGSSSLRCHASFYLAVHCLASMLSFVWPVVCFWSRIAHITFGALVFAGAAWSGAGYYEYLMAVRYTKVVQQLLNSRKSAREHAREALAGNP